MSHAITHSDSMFSVRERPWHGLGVVLDAPPATTAEALNAAGLDWSVVKRPVFHHLEPDHCAGDDDNNADGSFPGGFEPVPGFWATVRADTGTVLGIVGPRYRVVQNHEALEFLDNLIGSALHFETAGSLHGGRRVWALAKTPDHLLVGGDPTDLFVLITNSHDGSTAIQAAITPIRVVCQNTLTWGLQRAKRTHSIRHTGSLSNRVVEARRVLDLTVDYGRQFKAFGDRLALEPFTDRRLRTVLEELYPAGLADAAPRARRSRQQTKDAITELFLRGATVGNAAHTKWSAANAIVEHLDWLRPTRSTSKAASAEQRFARALDDHALKTRAMQLVAAA